jgi:hypothetical protein
MRSPNVGDEVRAIQGAGRSDTVGSRVSLLGQGINHGYLLNCGYLTYQAIQMGS